MNETRLERAKRVAMDLAGFEAPFIQTWATREVDQRKSRDCAELKHLVPPHLKASDIAKQTYAMASAKRPDLFFNQTGKDSDGEARDFSEVQEETIHTLEINEDISLKLIVVNVVNETRFEGVCAQLPWRRTPRASDVVIPYLFLLQNFMDVVFQPMKETPMPFKIHYRPPLRAMHRISTRGIKEAAIPNFIVGDICLELTAARLRLAGLKSFAFTKRECKNLVCTTFFPTTLDSLKLQQQHDPPTLKIYRKKKFPGIVIKRKDLAPRTMLAFPSGATIVVGAKTKEGAIEAYDKLAETVLQAAEDPRLREHLVSSYNNNNSHRKARLFSELGDQSDGPLAKKPRNQ